MEKLTWIGQPIRRYGCFPTGNGSKVYIKWEFLGRSDELVLCFEKRIFEMKFTEKVAV